MAAMQRSTTMLVQTSDSPTPSPKPHSELTSLPLRTDNLANKSAVSDHVNKQMNGPIGAQ